MKGAHLKLLTELLRLGYEVTIWLQDDGLYYAYTFTPGVGGIGANIINHQGCGPTVEKALENLTRELP